MIFWRGMEMDYLRHRINSGFKGYWWKGYKWRYLKQREIRLFGLRAERLFLDPIGYGNKLKLGYFWVGGVKKPPHE